MRNQATKHQWLLIRQGGRVRVNHQICRTPLMTAQAPNLRMWYAPNASAADISDTPFFLCFQDLGVAEDFGNAWSQGEVKSSEKSLTDCSVSEGVSSVSIHDRAVRRQWSKQG